MERTQAEEYRGHYAYKHILFPEKVWNQKYFGACNGHGDAISYYQKINSVSFPEAVKAMQ